MGCIRFFFYCVSSRIYVIVFQDYELIKAKDREALAVNKPTIK